MMKLMKMNQINDFLDSGIGIIQTIQSTYSSTFTWLSSTDAETLDMEYYLNHSGDNYISPITYKLYVNDDTTYLTKLASIIKLKFADKWNKLYKAFFVDEYNPIENYSMVEDENVNTDIENKSNGSNNVFAFNTESENGVPEGKNAITSTTKGKFDDNHRQLTRSGNIGVTTSQQMLQSEIDLRQWDFYNMMMDDIDSIMCLDVRDV